MDGASDRHYDGFELEATLNLETIEEQIERLWSPETRRDDPISSLATHTSVLNLIIYVPDAETAREVQESSERISQVHPCRVILFVRAKHGSADRLVPDIYATCNAAGGDSAAPCIERIRIPVNQTLYSRLDAITQPLIIPELPAFLWWRGSPSTSDPTFLALARASNLTIIDSDRFDSLQELTEVNELDTQLSSGSAIVDFNWQRLQPWRELTAQFFDIESINWSLPWIREIEIDTGPTNNGDLPIQALMFASWIAYCLHWTPFEVRRTRTDRWYIGMRDRFGAHIRIIIRTRPGGTTSVGQLLAMSMTARNDDGDSSTLSLSRARGSSLIRMSASSGLVNTLHHAIHHRPLTDETLLLPILESTHQDPMFEGSLEKAVETINLYFRPEVT